MATLYVRARSLPNGGRRFDVKYRRGGRYTEIEHGGTFHTRREANIRRDRIAEWLAAGLNPKLELRRVTTPSQSLRVLHDGFIESRRRIDEKTRDGLRYRQKRIDHDLGDLPIDEITLEDVIEWIGSLEADYEASSIALYVGQLRQVFDFAGIPNVARDRRIELPRHVRKELDPPDAEEVVDLVSQLAPHLVVPVLTMEQVGSRVSETLALDRADVGEDFIRFRRETTKGKRKGRIVECSPLLCESLHRTMPFKFSRMAVGRGMSKLGHVHPHLLRHRRATLWHQQGVGAVELARRLGHSRPSMSLDVYANVKPLHEIADHDFASLLK